MKVHIESLSVKGLGPLPPLEWAFRDINLVYGRNEQGKTFITEYLLRSLFKDAPKYRDVPDAGQVRVSGLGSGVVLNPKARAKLDTLVPETFGTMKADLARLLVVRGGDSSLQPDKLGAAVTKTILKGYLSDQRVYDMVSGNIQANTLQSTFSEGQIVPKKAVGEIKEEANLKAQLDKLDRLTGEIEQELTLADVRLSQDKLAETRRQLEQQELTRRAEAYRLYQEQLKTEKSLKNLPQAEIDQANKHLGESEYLAGDIARTRSAIAELEPQAEHYDWLKNALDDCAAHPLAFQEDHLVRYLAIAGGSAFVGVLFALLRLPIVSVVIGILGLLGAGAGLYLAYRAYQQRKASEGDIREVHGVFAEYETRFGEQALTTVTLQTRLEQVSQARIKLDDKLEQLRERENQQLKTGASLNTVLSALAGEQVQAGDPRAQITALQRQRRELEAHLHETERKLAALNMPDEEYYEGTCETAYDAETYRRLKDQAQRLENAQRDAERALLALKQRVCTETNDEVGCRWEDLLAHLRDKRRETADARRDVKARIIGGILLGKVIDDLRKKEDERIAEALASPGMCAPLRQLTRYTNAELEGEEVVLYNRTERFPFASLSTGAQEQVLLALRIGIASHLLGETRMFLVLDDAFQHSDWTRRPVLVDQLATLAEMGWQVLYFTMDDNIRGLFEESVQPRMGERYGKFQLGE